MLGWLHISKHQLEAIAAIIFRNVFLLINGIIFAVVILLTAFGDVQEGLFLGLITAINIIIGCVQEINAWLKLEKLQLLASPKVIRFNADLTESIVAPEEIKEKDSIKLKTGDQVPCDGILFSSHGFEVSEALITGESAASLRKPGDKVYAGSIVTAGSGVLTAEKTFKESRIALMTASTKKYRLIQSPIQYSISRLIKYTGYLLLLVILFVGVRGFLDHESTVSIIQSIGALTSILLPQGMVVIVTLLFSYGAAHLYKRHVLLQQINATEKLGRIKNLCMDKTGTLTSSVLLVEGRHVMEGVSDSYAEESIAAYIKSAGDTSRTIEEIKKTLGREYTGEVIEDLTFSSTRQFGAAHVRDGSGERVILAGAPDVFLPHIAAANEKEWVQKFIDTEAKIGKRLICFVCSQANVLPQDLTDITLSVISIIVLNNALREGVVEAVQFFEDRGVTIRIISGDNQETVQAVARSAGVNNPQAVITGAELETWTDADFLERTRAYTIFARTKPEQKEKLIDALKHDGFTAMIGDGANDALAIKKADLGIAMFDGAQATRQIASVVLVENSFTDLPSGVKLADSVIQNIEICAGIFFNQQFLGFFFFVFLALVGHTFPFTPLNITFLTYFTVGLPVSLIFYWVVRPAHPHMATRPATFLRRVIPFAFFSAIPELFVVAIVYYFITLKDFEAKTPTSLLLLTFIIIGVIFFMNTPKVYSGPIARSQMLQFFLLAVIETVSFITLINIPFIASFYNLVIPAWTSFIEVVPLLFVYGIVQYALTFWFSIMPLPGSAMQQRTR
jgi:cation-transporting ATPase E